MKKYFLVALGFLAVFLLGSVLLGLSLNASSGDKEVLGREKLNLRPAQDPERGEIEEVLVPEDRIPTNFSERMKFASITLLPNHLQAPEARSDVQLPNSLEKRAKDVVSDFLVNWETYRVGDQTWQRGWESLVDPARKDEIAARNDSSDAPGVCPVRTCQVGSRWFGENPTIFPVDYDQEHIYLVAYGSLLYRGDPQINPYAGGSTERSYGIILVPQNGDLLVARVAAESLR